MLRKAVNRITRGEVQTLIDNLKREGLSASRIGVIVNAIRSLYRWAEGRELARDNPAQDVRLPAKDEKPRTRIAAPAEFVTLLRALYLPTPGERKEGKRGTSAGL
jgi:site-specific recombinase XerD